ncbi:MAG: RnfABCDGE type electron transport complex subunit D [Rhizobiaceae bacterium]
MNETVRNQSAIAPHPAGARIVLGRWDHNRVALVFLIALAPALGVSLVGRAAELLPVLALALAVTLVWTFVFAHFRRRQPGWDWIVTASVFAILIPDTVPYWQQALALTFGVVMGEQIFGGRGRNFLNPVVVALAFLMFSFPGELLGHGDGTLAIAAGVGGLLLLLVRLVSWRVVAGVVFGAGAGLMIAGEGASWAHLLSGTLVFACIFLIADPVAAASTSAGRWMYGLLAGMLVVVFGQSGGDPGSLRAIIFAALLAGILAPLIDQGVIWLNVRRRRRRG